MTTDEEDYYLEELSKRVKKCVDHFKKRGWIVVERLINFHMVLWLERRGAAYAVIYDPLELRHFWLAIKEEDDYRFFTSKWGTYVDEEFLKGKGWIKYLVPKDRNYSKQRNEHISSSIKWCADNLDNDFINGHYCLYFTKEAFMAYKLMWL